MEKKDKINKKFLNHNKYQKIILNRYLDSHQSNSLTTAMAHQTNKDKEAIVQNRFLKKVHINKENNHQKNNIKDQVQDKDQDPIIANSIMDHIDLKIKIMKYLCKIMMDLIIPIFLQNIQIILNKDLYTANTLITVLF